MTTQNNEETLAAAHTATIHRVEHELEAGAGGALAGAAVGAFSGPPGIIVGAVIGAIAGAIAGAVMDSDATRRAIHERELDDDGPITEREPARRVVSPEGPEGTRETAVQPTDGSSPA